MSFLLLRYLSLHSKILFEDRIFSKKVCDQRLFSREEYVTNNFYGSIFPKICFHRKLVLILRVHSQNYMYWLKPVENEILSLLHLLGLSLVLFIWNIDNRISFEELAAYHLMVQSTLYINHWLSLCACYLMCDRHVF